MKSNTSKPIPKIQGRVNHVFNGEMVYLMAKLINRLVDEVNSLNTEMDKLQSRISDLEKKGKSNDECSL